MTWFTPVTGGMIQGIYGCSTNERSRILCVKCANSHWSVEVASIMDRTMID